MITADEEMGAALGAKWLCEEHPEAVRSDMVVNEGGGASFELGGRRFYTLCVGEKGVNRFLLRASGRAGHASVPALGDNALLKLAPAAGAAARPAAAGADRRPGSPSSRGCSASRSTATTRRRSRGRSSACAGSPRPLAAYVAEPMLRVTMVPTRAHASDKDNVIPSRAEVLVDCRVPPGCGAEEARERLDGAARPARGPSSRSSSPRASSATARRRSRRSRARSPTRWPRSTPTPRPCPFVFAGFSDSHWFRKAFDSATVYGFCPQRELDLFRAAPLVHGADERAAVADVELAASFYADLCRRVLG